MLSAILAVVAVLTALFFRTRLGLSIRATGDNADMVRASSINPAFTITVGLCVANSLTGLAGCLTGLVNKSCDINLGTGMVTVALASLIIGETMFGRFSIGLRILGVIAGSCIYRIIIAVALAANVPTECFKLVSALIVAVARSSSPSSGRSWPGGRRARNAEAERYYQDLQSRHRQREKGAGRGFPPPGPRGLRHRGGLQRRG